SIYKSSGKINGNRYQHMIALVATVLGMLYIIFQRNDLQIPLLGEHICNQINVRSKRTDYTDSGNVPDMFYHVFYVDFVSILFQLFNNAFRCLDPGFNMFYRSVMVNMLEFIIKYFNLGVDLL